MSDVMTTLEVYLQRHLSACKHLLDNGIYTNGMNMDSSELHIIFDLGLFYSECQNDVQRRRYLAGPKVKGFGKLICKCNNTLGQQPIHT